MRIHGKLDANQHEIVDALRNIGADVLSLAPMGNGCPDLLVHFRGVTMLMEVKSATGKLTPDEVEFIENWRGQVHIVRSVDDALRMIGVI